MVNPPGDESVNAGAYTPTANVVVALSAPQVPVTVTAKLPTAAELLAVSVIKLELVVGFGINEAVTPAGRPEMARFTLPAKPFWG